MTKECVAAYRADGTVVLKPVVDSDWASSREDRKSTPGARFTIGGFRVHHTCATQPGLPSMSSGEAELRALSKAACDLVYLQGVAAEMGITATLQVECDSTAAEMNSRKLGPGKMKHLELGAYAVKEMVRRRMLEVNHIDGTWNAADVHTKHVDAVTLQRFIGELGRRRRQEGDLGRMVVQTRVNTIETIKRAEPVVVDAIDVGKLGDILEWGLELEQIDRGIPSELRRNRELQVQRADDSD
jgi:hypothetical protein